MRFSFFLNFLILISLLLISSKSIGQSRKHKNKKHSIVSNYKNVSNKEIQNTDTLKLDSVPKINYEKMIDSIIFCAERYLGTRYRSGGTTCQGFDCSGFTSFVFGNYGIKLPHSSRDQALKGMPLDITEIKRGDLVFFKGRNARSSVVGHVGLVVEKNDSIIRFIHSSNKKGIAYDFISTDYYKNRFIGAKRILGNNIHDSLWANFKLPDLSEEDSLGPEADTNKIEIVKSSKIKHETLPSKSYCVKKGETLYAVSKKNNTTPEKIKEMNNLKSDKIYPGQNLVVKYSIGSEIDTNKIEIVKPLKIKQETKNMPSESYCVKKGETLYAIAKKNNTTPEKIKELNNLDKEKIYPGQKLIVK